MGIRIQVSRAGIAEVNGIYYPCGESDGVFKFERLGVWEEQETVFSLLRCEKSQHWFISITAEYDRDTTIHCIDLYIAIAQGVEKEIPPKDTWTCTTDGVLPTPLIHIFKIRNDEDNHYDDNTSDINDNLTHVTKSSSQHEMTDNLSRSSHDESIEAEEEEYHADPISFLDINE